METIVNIWMPIYQERGHTSYIRWQLHLNIPKLTKYQRKNNFINERLQSNRKRIIRGLTQDLFLIQHIRFNRFNTTNNNYKGPKDCRQRSWRLKIQTTWLPRRSNPRQGPKWETMQTQMESLICSGMFILYPVYDTARHHHESATMRQILQWSAARSQKAVKLICRYLLNSKAQGITLSPEKEKGLE